MFENITNIAWKHTFRVFKVYNFSYVMKLGPLYASCKVATIVRWIQLNDNSSPWKLTVVATAIIKNRKLIIKCQMCSLQI